MGYGGLVHFRAVISINDSKECATPRTEEGRRGGTYRALSIPECNLEGAHELPPGPLPFAATRRSMWV
jgi:hypothetical protein